MKHLAKKILSIIVLIYLSFIKFIYPSICFVCKKYIQGNSDAICSDCWLLLKLTPSPYCSCCQNRISEGFEKYSDSQHQNITTLLCINCQSKSKPYFDSCRAVWIYDNKSIRTLILAFKHGDKTQLSKLFTTSMISYWEKYILNFDIIIPVPINRFRLLKRRYNQASFLAYQLYLLCGIPYNNNALMRYKSTPSLGRYSHTERRKILINAFKINYKYRNLILGKKVLLIDDVMTTGQTLNQCAKMLKKSGAINVGAIIVAKNKLPIKVN